MPRNWIQDKEYTAKAGGYVPKKKKKSKDDGFPVDYDQLDKYYVVQNGIILFSDPCFSICNSFIFQTGLQGIRPTNSL